MNNSEIVGRIMFDYESLSADEIVFECSKLPRKIVRWLGANHPDNRTRILFFTTTNIDIGEGTVINSNFVVSDGYNPFLKIGKRAAISPSVTVICESSPNNSRLHNNKYVNENLICGKPVTLEDDVWIGAHVVILPGVTIGKGSVVGAGSVVTKDVPSGVIFAGNPAKLIRTI